MATIQITAFADHNGPSLPSKHGAILGEKEISEGVNVKILRLFIGDCEIQIWPADPDCIKDLAKKLDGLANQLHAEEFYRSSE